MVFVCGKWVPRHWIVFSVGVVGSVAAAVWISLTIFPADPEIPSLVNESLRVPAILLLAASLICIYYAWIVSGFQGLGRRHRVVDLEELEATASPEELEIIAQWVEEFLNKVNVMGSDEAEEIQPGEICSICLVELPEDGTDVFMAPKCNHVLHQSCLMKWILSARKAKCPNCNNRFYDKIDSESPLHYIVRNT